MSVTVTSVQRYQVEIQADDHQWIADEPLGTGDNLGPDPFELLLGSLGACTVITLHMYANRKKWPLEKVRMRLDTYRKPPAEGSDPAVFNTVIETELAFEGDLTVEQRARLLEIAARCPVHRTLTGNIEIHATLAG